MLVAESILEVLKFDPYHDASGKFTSAAGAGQAKVDSYDIKSKNKTAFSGDYTYKGKKIGTFSQAKDGSLGVTHISGDYVSGLPEREALDHLAKVHSEYLSTGKVQAAEPGEGDVVYHGTDEKAAREILRSHFEESFYGALGPGIYASHNKDVADLGYAENFKQPAVLKLTLKPGLKLKNYSSEEFKNVDLGEEHRAKLEKEGYSGFTAPAKEGARANDPNERRVKAFGEGDYAVVFSHKSLHKVEMVPSSVVKKEEGLFVGYLAKIPKTAQKSNPYHDPATGEFTSGGGGGVGPQTLTGKMFDREAKAPVEFNRFVKDRLKSGQWTAEELALTVKNSWLAGKDVRYEDALRDIKKVAEHHGITVQKSNPYHDQQGLFTSAANDTHGQGHAGLPVSKPYRSRIIPTHENQEHRARMHQYMSGFHSKLKNLQERAYVAERSRQMINGEVRPKGMSAQFGLTKQRAIQFEALTYRIFQSGRTKIGV